MTKKVQGDKEATSRRASSFVLLVLLPARLASSVPLAMSGYGTPPAVRSRHSSDSSLHTPGTPTRRHSAVESRRALGGPSALRGTPVSRIMAMEGIGAIRSPRKIKQRSWTQK